jgi:hypothetical protein
MKTAVSRLRGLLAALAIRAHIALLAVLAVALLAVGCSQLSPEDQEKYQQAKEQGQVLAEKISALEGSLGKLIAEGAQLEPQLVEIKRKINAGEIPAAEAFELLSRLVTRKAEISAAVAQVKTDLEAAKAAAGKWNDQTKELRNKNLLAYLSLIGNLVLTVLGGAALKRGGTWAAAFGIASRALDAATQGKGGPLVLPQLAECSLTADDMRGFHSQATLKQV